MYVHKKCICCVYGGQSGTISKIGKDEVEVEEIARINVFFFGGWQNSTFRTWLMPENVTIDFKYDGFCM